MLVVLLFLLQMLYLRAQLVTVVQLLSSSIMESTISISRNGVVLLSGVLL